MARGGKRLGAGRKPNAPEPAPREWTEFDQGVASEICARLMDGQSLRAICRDESLPSERTIFNWLAANKGFVQQYTRARDVQADVMFDEMHDIADTRQDDFKAWWG